MKKAKVFLIYFPIILVALQVLCNLLGLLAHEIYMGIGFYLNTFLGTNVLFSLFLVIFTYSYSFCSVSRYAAIAECLFAINFMVVQDDNLYNITFQIIVGSVALLGTLKYYIHKFPLCTFSLVTKFFKSLMATTSCKEAVARFERDVIDETNKKIINERILKNRPIAHYKF